MRETERAHGLRGANPFIGRRLGTARWSSALACDGGLRVRLIRRNWVGAAPPGLGARHVLLAIGGSRSRACPSRSPSLFACGEGEGAGMRLPCACRTAAYALFLREGEGGRGCSAWSDWGSPISEEGRATACLAALLHPLPGTRGRGLGWAKMAVMPGCARRGVGLATRTRRIGVRSDCVAAVAAKRAPLASGGRPACGVAGAALGLPRRHPLDNQTTWIAHADGRQRSFDFTSYDNVVAHLRFVYTSATDHGASTSETPPSLACSSPPPRRQSAPHLGEQLLTAASSRGTCG